MEKRFVERAIAYLQEVQHQYAKGELTQEDIPLVCLMATLFDGLTDIADSCEDT